MVAVALVLNSGSIEPHGNCSSFSSSQDYKCRLINSKSSKSDYFQFLESPFSKKEFILQSREGSDSLMNDEQERLLESILDKTKEMGDPQASINKVLQKYWDIFKPLVTD